MGSSFLIQLIVAGVPASIVYFLLRIRIDELVEVLDSQRERSIDKFDYVHEQLDSIRSLFKSQTKTFSTSAPAAVISAPAKKRTRKQK